MDVLFVGLSPELILPASFPAHLATVRQGGNVPADPWDAVFVRWTGEKEDVLAQTLKRSASSLRHGGQLGLVALPPSPEDEGPLDELLTPFGEGREVNRSSDRGLLVVVRNLAAGRQDLVGLRRCLSALSANVGRLEALTSDVREGAADRRPIDGRSIKEIVGHLGDMDRDGYLACIHAILDDSDPVETPIDADAVLAKRDHNGRPLSELVTRFRHFRYQSAELIDNLAEDDWLRTGANPDGRQSTVADIVRTWARVEEEQVSELERRLM